MSARPSTFAGVLAIDPTITDRFWANVVITDGCWTWSGNRLPLRQGKKWTCGNYGQIHLNCGPAGVRKQVIFYAHRLSWLMHYGPIPRGMLICHRCDNPPCVRPDHLFAGTASDNTQDMLSKGRHSTREAEDLTGLRFGKLLILGGAPGAWSVQCDCGRRVQRYGPRCQFEDRPDCGCEKGYRILTLDSISKTEAEWAAHLGISRQALDQRLDKGWSLRRALTTTKTPGTNPRRSAA